MRRGHVYLGGGLGKRRWWQQEEGPFQHFLPVAWRLSPALRCPSSSHFSVTALTHTGQGWWWFLWSTPPCSQLLTLALMSESSGFGLGPSQIPPLHLPAMWPWVIYFHFLSLHFHMCEMVLMTLLIIVMLIIIMVLMTLPHDCCSWSNEIIQIPGA